MAIGISGTRHGCNVAQRYELTQILEDAFDISGGWFHHGDCVGVDAEAHEIARRIGYLIKIFPPENPKHRAFCIGDEVAHARPYILRNHDIVNESASMLIVPEKAMEDAPRSGTWETYRYSLAAQVPTQVIVGGRFEFTPVEDVVPLFPPPQLPRG
jgi:hypothetical protein